MALIVQKYGGTSVGSPDRIRSVAARIAQAYSLGNDVLVVVSAMGGTTDDLIGLAHQVSKTPPHREMDMLLSSGERISMALLSMALTDLKVPAISFTGSQSGIITTQNHRRARIKKILGDRLREAIAQRKVAIVAGFQGVSESKEITTLGRGGSDTTAVALAAHLRAERCEIYTDVDGIYTADPSVVKNAKLLAKVPVDIMTELSHLGAGVLHSRCTEIVSQSRVPLWIKNSLNENEGTLVTEKVNAQIGMEDFGITGVAANLDQLLLTIELSRPTVLSSIWDRAKELGLNLTAPSFSALSKEPHVHFFIDREGEGDWLKILSELARDGFVRKYEFHSGICPVSIVGYRFTQDCGALNEMIEALAQVHISAMIGSASPLSVTLGVATGKAEDAVRALHGKYIEKLE